MSFDLPTTYALDYCRYDVKSGNRPWSQLTRKQIREIDQNIAREAFRATNSADEAAKVIFFGSPAAQRITDEIARNKYVASVLTAVAMSAKPITKGS